ncbi:MAG: hypothetical protein AB7O43_15260 [Hyphomicrobiaceae bacterium]
MRMFSRYASPALATFTLAVLVGLAAPSAARSAELTGAWSGGGRVVFSGGQSERAVCRARFTRRSSSRYVMNAVCATQSARVSQTATVRHMSGNSFYGSFFNEDYNLRGTLRILLRGNRLTASLLADSGAAHLSLRRR